jgi:hypothetical protein
MHRHGSLSACHNNAVDTMSSCKHGSLVRFRSGSVHLSMTQSVPSSTALATSVASARVGRGFFTMLSSICVAVMTGLPTCM